MPTTPRTKSKATPAKNRSVEDKLENDEPLFTSEYPEAIRLAANKIALTDHDISKTKSLIDGLVAKFENDAVFNKAFTNDMQRRAAIKMACSQSTDLHVQEERLANLELRRASLTAEREYLKGMFDLAKIHLQLKIEQV